MDVGIEGALFIWAGLILGFFWPLILMPLFVWVKRRSLAKKWKFFIFGVGICYFVHLAIVLLWPPFIPSDADQAAPLPMLGRLLAPRVVSISLALVALHFLAKKFRPMAS